MDRLQQILEQKRQDPSYRLLKECFPLDGAHVILEEEKWLNFTSHDYLSLSHHTDLKKSSIKALLQQGISEISAQVKNGQLECQKELENKLAELLGKETALLCPSRSHAFHALFSAFSAFPLLFFVPSTYSAASPPYLSLGKAEVHFYDPHALSELDQLLEETKNSSYLKVVLAESLIYPEGYRTNLKQLSEIAKRQEAVTLLDETYAFGMLGTHGMGLGAHLPEIDILLASFNRACGASGAFIATSSLIKEYLLQFCVHAAEFALIPAAIGSIDAALDLIVQMEGERAQIEQRGFWLKKKFEELGFVLEKSCNYFLALSLPSCEEVSHLLQALARERILASPFFERKQVSFTLNIQHTPEHLHHLVEAVRDWSKTSADLFATAMHSSTETPLR